ncbi:MAG TPA: glycoside hydrolase family 16 protein [Gemmatimonadaceae bacterium]|nr:glycoside hydrolase family 16 protein [Gemmatimonadaceae bacterium]
MSCVRQLRVLFALVVAGCASATTNGAGVTSPNAPAGWTLAWSDEFNGAAGASFDRGKWVADTGGAGWGNQEREFYTTRAENIALDGSGHLVLTVRAEPAASNYSCWYGKCGYTSARIKTKGLFAQTYGRFEARIRIPRGQGLWPAFWMLGDNIDAVGWPQSGEIDIMENIGREPATIHGTMHGPGYSGGSGIGGPYSLTRGAFADDYHVYAVEWSPNLIQWLVDDVKYFRTTPASIPAGKSWVYDHPFFLLLNVAVGGGWPNDPDATTTFPQTMVVDYVRVYRK